MRSVAALLQMIKSSGNEKDKEHIRYIVDMQMRLRSRSRQTEGKALGKRILCSSMEIGF